MVRRPTRTMRSIGANTKMTPGPFGRGNGDGAHGDDVSLRGLSWIVTDAEPGVAILIEIPSGVVGAGPFELPADELTKMIARAISPEAREG